MQLIRVRRTSPELPIAYFRHRHSLNRSLREAIKTQGELSFDKAYNCYWRFEGEKKEGPYYSVCWHDDKKLVRLRADKQQMEDERNFGEAHASVVFAPYYCKYSVSFRTK